MSDRIYRPIVVISLILLVIIQAINVVNYWQARTRCTQTLEQVNDIADLALAAVDASISYEDVAYGPQVDRIAEQQLIAEETQMQQLSIIASEISSLARLIATSGCTP